MEILQNSGDHIEWYPYMAQNEKLQTIVPQTKDRLIIGPT